MRRLGSDFVEFDPALTASTQVLNHPFFADLFTMTGPRPFAVIEFVGRPLVYLAERTAFEAESDPGAAIARLRFRLACRGDRAYLLIVDNEVEILPCEITRSGAQGLRLATLSRKDVATLATEGLGGLCREKALPTQQEASLPLRDRLTELLNELIRSLRDTFETEALHPQIEIAVELIAATLLIRKSLDTVDQFEGGLDQAFDSTSRTPLSLARFRSTLERFQSEIPMLRLAGNRIENLSDLSLAMLLPLLTGVRTTTTPIPGWRDLDFRHISGMQIADAFSRVLYGLRAEMDRSCRPGILPPLPYEVADYAIRLVAKDVGQSAGVVTDAQCGTGPFLAAVIRLRARLTAGQHRRTARLIEGLIAQDRWSTHLAIADIVARWTLLEITQSSGVGQSISVSTDVSGEVGNLIGRVDPTGTPSRIRDGLETNLVKRSCRAGGRFAVVVHGSLLHSFEPGRKAERERLLSTLDVEAILDFTPTGKISPFMGGAAILIGTQVAPLPGATGVYQPAPRVFAGRIGLGDDSLTIPYALSVLRERHWMLRAMALGGGPEARVLDRVVADHPTLAKDLEAHEGRTSEMRSSRSSPLPGTGLSLAVTPRFSQRDLEAAASVELTADPPSSKADRIVIRSGSEAWMRHLDRILQSALPGFWLSLMTGPEAQRTRKEFSIRDLVGLPMAPMIDGVRSESLTPDAYMAQVYGLDDDDLALMQSARRRSAVLQEEQLTSGEFGPDEAMAYASALDRVLRRLHPGEDRVMTAYLGSRGPWALFQVNRGSPVDPPDLDTAAEVLSINAHLSRQLIHHEADAYLLARPRRRSEFRPSACYDEASRYLRALASHDGR